MLDVSASFNHPSDATRNSISWILNKEMLQNQKWDGISSRQLSV